MTLPKAEGGLGYKDHHTFNIAMLTKQAWRLLTNPSSLCAQVLKARYYPDSDVLHAELKSGASYAWRSIMQGVDALKGGVIRRIGNGVETNMWTDPWLPRDGGRLPITPRGHTVLQRRLVT